MKAKYLAIILSMFTSVVCAQRLPVTDNLLQRLSLVQDTEKVRVQQRYQYVGDTLLNKEKFDQISKLKTLYQDQKKQEQIQLLQAWAEKEKILRYVLMGGILLILMFGILLYNQQRIKIRKNKQLFASEQKLTAEQLKNIRLHEIQLEQELAVKNKELTIYALNFIQKNQLMEELKEKIISIRKDVDGKVSRHLNNLQHTIRYSFNLDKDWDDFRVYFEQVHHRFFHELKSQFPDLSNKELRLCALLKLNLSSKEMSTILGISPGSVKMARYRLRKKLNLSSESDLTAFMIKLEKTVSGNPL